MKTQSLRELPSYTVTSEEFLLDYMPLPDEQKLVLFKLRMGYVMKGSSLTADDIEGFCPAFTDQQKVARQKVLERFFRRENDHWIDDKIETMIEAKNKQNSHRASISAERSKSGRMGARKRFHSNSEESNDKDLTVEKQNSQQKGSNNHGKTVANAMANAKQNDGKTVANAMANAKQNDGKTVANAMANAKQNDGKTVANAMANAKQNDKFVCNSLKNQKNEISENQCEIADSESLAYTRTRARASDPINNINLLNKNKIIRSDARTRTHARTREENQEKIKEFFEVVSSTKTWSTEQLMELLGYSGLAHSALESWIGRSPFNHDKFKQLASSMKFLGSGDFLNVVSRCKAAKEKENREFKTSVAFVIKALEKEIGLIHERSKPPDPPVKIERFSDKVYRKEGLIQMADGSYRFATRSQR